MGQGGSHLRLLLPQPTSTQPHRGDASEKGVGRGEEQPHRVHLYLFGAVLGLLCHVVFFSRCGERDCSLAAVHGLLMAVISPIMKHGLSGTAQQLKRMGLDAPQHVGSSQTRDQTLCPLHWQADNHPLRHQGGPLVPCERGFYIPAEPTLCSIVQVPQPREGSTRTGVPGEGARDGPGGTVLSEHRLSCRCGKSIAVIRE